MSSLGAFCFLVPVVCVSASTFPNNQTQSLGMHGYLF